MAVGIPGEIYGLWEAHKLGGKLPWRVVFQPAIKLCREGFKMTNPLHYALTRRVDVLSDPSFVDVFINKTTKKLYQIGDLIKMPKLAQTLEIISETNIEEFYHGDLAKQIVNEINQNGIQFQFY